MEKNKNTKSYEIAEAILRKPEMLGRTLFEANAIRRLERLMRVKDGGFYDRGEKRVDDTDVSRDRDLVKRLQRENRS